MIILDSSKFPVVTPMPASVAPTITSQVSPWLAWLVYPLGRFAVLPFYFDGIQVSGQEHLPKSGPTILAPTHRSRWDALMLPYATGRHVTGRDLRFMVSVNEVSGLQGWFIRRLGGFPIDPQHPGIGSLRHGVEILLNQQMLVIFPEGGIFRDHRVHPLKPGLSRIALQAESSQPGLGVKIVPVSLRYSATIPRKGCRVKIVIGAPLLAADYCKGTGKKDSQQLTADLERALQQIDAS